MSSPSRSSGVLLHPTALPGNGPCGSLGAEARAWIDLLISAGIGVWQVLPLAPTDGTGSPYSSPSGSALNPWLIDADDLLAEGLISADDHAALPCTHGGRLEPALATQRSAAIGAALGRQWSRQSSAMRERFEHWRRSQRNWLDDHCQFMVLRALQEGRPWWEWPGPLAQRQQRALRQLQQHHGDELLQEALLQWQLQEQWERLQRRAHAGGLRLVGDLPFYVAHDSVDVWCRRGLFSVRLDGSLSEQSGVPPDYFAETGQLWGTPVYHWWRHRLSGFRWWLQRLERQLDLFDLLRLDHFRALEAYWSVPGGAATAEHGQWCPSPGRSLLNRLRRLCRRQGRLVEGQLPLIAEDLGVITPEVEALRDRFALPGMKILQFAFDGATDNPYLPANFVGDRWVVYTGTHDNATTLGWWRQLDPDSRGRVRQAVGAEVHSPGWQLLELALGSRAELVVVPLQDLLELGDEARFNTPGTASGNWSWRLDQPVASLHDKLQGLGAMSARHGRGGAATGS
ncbi:4-alpha-glucanotransferase [Synechococcus sp. CBW1004]|uniref:4-alpha-glucanotransferase n=1 Tax=Synechococcus sp. CBW1004 TaxID=1353136 RepID=UPI0018CE0EB4|nr:4-alpha-glucanotransferase [Synechococcus sp. CBW1004]QPN64189.1 4-alpha-glucanotransferase [Synechococcus sp. CBW1004]